MNKVNIIDICDIQVGKTPSRSNPSYWGDGSLWLSIADMNQGRDLSVTSETITEKAVNECNCKLIPKNTVLFSFKLSIGKVGITKVPMYTNEAIAAFGIKDYSKLDTSYLYYALKSVDRSIGSNKAVMGKTLNKEKLRQFKIPLPILENQKEVVKTLNQADELRCKRKKAINLLDEYLKSVFEELFGECITNSDNSAKELRGYIKVIGGYAFKSTDFVTDGIPVIKIGTVNKGFFDLSACSFISNNSLNNKKIERFKIYHGDLLMSLTGTVGKEDYGNICEATSQYPLYLLNQRVAKIEYDNTFTKEFLFYFFKHNKIKSQLTKISRGVRQANISNEDIMKIKLAIPEINMQTKFSKIVKNVMLLKQKMSKQSIELDNQFNALMQQSFNSN